MALTRILETLEWRPGRWEAGPSLVLVSGVAGSGKTFSVERAFGSERRALVRRGPLLPELLRSLHSRLNRDPDPTLQQLARTWVPDLRWGSQIPAIPWPTTLSQQAAAVAGGLNRAASRENGLAVIFEDAHDWNTDDWTVLRALWEQAAEIQAPLPLILTARPGLADAEWQSLCDDLAFLAVLRGGRHTPPLRLDLTALDFRGMEALIQEHLGGTVDPALAGWVFSRSEGHPLQTVEWLHHLRSCGALQAAPWGWAFTPPALNTLPPAPLTSLLQARWRSLGNQDAARVATALATAGRPVPLQLLGRVLRLGQERLEDAVNTLRLHGLVGGAEQGLISLSHPLYPPLIRADTLPEERMEIAGLLAAELPDSDDRARLGRLAGHPLAVAWTRAARVAASERQAHAMTEHHARALLDTRQADGSDLLALARSLRHQGRSSEIPAILDGLPGYESGLERCLALQNLAPPGEVLEQFRALVPQEDSDSTVMHALYCVPLLLRLGEIAEATAELLRLERLLSACAPVTAGYWHERMARLCSAQQNWAGETEHGTRALELAVAHGDDPLACRAHLQRAVGLFGLQNLSAAAASLEQLIALAEHCGEGEFSRFGVGNLATIRGELGDLHGARTLLARQVQVFDRAQEPTLAYALHNLAAVLDELGDGAALEAGLRAEALFAGREDGQVRLAHERDANALRLAYAGRATEARTRLDRCHSQEPGGSLPHRLLALLELGEHAQARQVLDSLGTWPEDAGALCMLSAGAGRLNHPQAADLSRAAMVCAEQNQQIVLQHVARALTGEPSGEAGLQAAGARGWLRLLPQTSSPPATALPTPTSFLWTLGRLTLEHSGEFRSWRGRKVQFLLALLLSERVARGRGLTRQELIPALWPDSEEEQAQGTLRQTIGRLREVTGSALTLQRTADGHWQLHDLRSDLTLFLQACEAGRPGEALAWYGGAFLPSLDDPWINQARDRLTMMRRQAVLTLAHAHTADTHDTETACTLAQIIEWLEILLRDDVLDTEVFSQYVRLGRLGPQHLSAGMLDMLRTSSAEMGDGDSVQLLSTFRRTSSQTG